MLRGDVLLVSRNHFMRRGLAGALSQDTLSVVGDEPSAEAALALLQSGRQHIDVILFDAESADDMAGLKAIADQFPQICIVLLAPEPSALSHGQVAGINVRAVLPHCVSERALSLTLQLAMLDENLFLAAGQPAEGMRSAPHPPRPAGVPVLLSPRETEILRLIEKGAPNKLIAQELDVAEATVKVHVKSVLRKIDARNRTQAAIWANSHFDGTDYRAA